MCFCYFVPKYLLALFKCHTIFQSDNLRQEFLCQTTRALQCVFDVSFFYYFVPSYYFPKYIVTGNEDRPVDCTPSVV